jgi:hypothetical protein
MPDAVREAIRDIPKDYGSKNWKRLLIPVVAAGGIRLPGQGKPNASLDTLGQHKLSSVCQE